MKPISCIIFALSICLIQSSQAQILHKSLAFQEHANIGKIFFEQMDYNNDGQIEFLADSNGKMVIGKIQDGKKKIFNSSRDFGEISTVKLYDIDNNGISEIYLVSGFEYIYELDLENLTVKDSILTNEYNITDIHYGQIDKNYPATWNLISDHSFLPSYILLDNEKIPLPENVKGDRIFTANVDLDEDEELIFEYSNGYKVLDPNTLEIDFWISSEFGNFSFGDADNNGAIEFYYQKDEKIYKHDYTNPDDIVSATFPIFPLSNDIAVVNIDDDPKEEVIIYSKNRADNDIVILNEELKITSYIDLPFESENYSGKILAANHLIDDATNQIIFSDYEMYFVDVTTGKLQQKINCLRDFDLFGFGVYLENESPHYLIKENSYYYSDTQVVGLVNYEEKYLEKEIPQTIVSPAGYGFPVDNFVGQFSTLNSQNDIILSDTSGLHFISVENMGLYSSGEIIPHDQYIIEDLDGNGIDEVITLDIENELISIFLYQNNSFTLFQTAAFEGNYISAIDTDLDGILEVLVFDDNHLKVVRSSDLTFIEEYDIDHNEYKDYAPSYDENGNPVLYLLANDNLEKLSFNPFSSTRNPIEENTYGSISSFQLNDDGTIKSYALITGKEVSVYNENIQHLETITLSTNGELGGKNIIHNFDQDDKLNAVCEVDNKIYDIFINLDGELYQPFNLISSHPKNDQFVNTNETLLLKFDNVVLTEDLEDALKIIEIESGDEIEYELTTQDNYNFQINSITAFKVIKNYQIQIGSSLKSAIDNVLNTGNNDFLTINFTIGNQLSEYTFTVEQPSNTVYRNTKRIFSFTVNETTDFNKPLVSSLVISPNNILQDLQPVDQVFDENTENFQALVDFENVNAPTAAVYIITQNTAQQIDTFTYLMNIIDEVGTPMKRANYNDINTKSLSKENTTNNLSKVWELELNGKYNSILKTIVGEGDYLYDLRDLSENFIDNVQLLKIEKQTGLIVDSLQLENVSSFSNMLLDNGLLYFQTAGLNYRMRCIDIITMSEVWNKIVANDWSKLASPVVYEDYLLFHGGFYEGLYNLNRWTGETNWQVPTATAGYWGPSIFGEKVITSGQGSVRVIDIDSGELAWHRTNTLSFKKDQSPLVDTIRNTIIYSGKDNVACYDFTSSDIIWQIQEDEYHELALYDDELFLSSDTELKKINAVSGEIVQVVPLDIEGKTLMIIGDYILLSNGKDVQIINKNTLQFAGKIYNQGGEISIVDDLIVISKEGKITAFQIEEGCLDFEQYDETACQGESFFINNLIFEEAGIYYDTITDINECDLVQEYVLSYYTIPIIADTIINSDNGNSSGAITVIFEDDNQILEYEWSNGETTENIQGLNAGNYNLSISDEFGCIHVFDFEVPLNTSTQNEDQGASIYPTLLKNDQIIHLQNTITQEYKIVNMSGQLLEKGKVQNQSIPLNVNYRTGVYFLYLNDENHGWNTPIKFVVY